MKVDILVVGEIETNCYLLTKDNQTIIIDPGAEGDKIIKYVDDNKLNLVGYLITHSHYDHVDALPEIIERYKIDEYQSSEVFNFQVIKTPGHLEDSVCFYFELENICFTGDTLFKGTIGRFDLEGANRIDLFESLDKLILLPDETIIYPGHGDKSTIGDEKKSNIWLQ